jgi:hypothetical protein
MRGDPMSDPGKKKEGKKDAASRAKKRAGVRLDDLLPGKDVAGGGKAIFGDADSRRGT